MGTDIWLFCEARMKKHKKKLWMPMTLEEWDDPRDYELFYLLAGVRGYELNTYPPIAPCKGLPEDINPLTIKDDFDSLQAAQAVSHYTLKELKDSDYSKVMKLKGWVYEDEYKEERGTPYYVHLDAPIWEHPGMVLKEWFGFINGNLISIIRQMETIKDMNKIEDEEDIRIVFWMA